MYIPSEWLLALALVAIYLFDSAQFLCIGEAVIGTRSGSPRQLSFGSSFELGGRRPYLPNPLTPFWPELRVEWNSAQRALIPSRQALSEMKRHLTAVRTIGWFACVCGALIAIIAPLALVTGQQGAFVVAALLCVVCAVPACVLVFRSRKDLGLSAWQAASLTLVALICLPCSANLARAVASHRRWTLAASELPSLGFDPARVARIQRELPAVLARARRYWPEDSAEYRSISEQLELLEARSNERG